MELSLLPGNFNERLATMMGGTQSQFAFDAPRLGRQLGCVAEVMRDGKFRSLPEIQSAMRERGVEAMLPAISARLRELRGRGHAVDKRLKAPGLYEYRVS